MANKEGHVGGVSRVRGLRYELISYFDKRPITPRITKNVGLRLNPRLQYRRSSGSARNVKRTLGSFSHSIHDVRKYQRVTLHLAILS